MQTKRVFKPRCEVWKYFDNIVEEGVAVCRLCKHRLRNYSSYVLRRHIQKLHNSKNVIWRYFVNLVDEGLAMCKQCKHLVRNNRTFNLTQHLQVAHNITVTVVENLNMPLDEIVGDLPLAMSDGSKDNKLPRISKEVSSSNVTEFIYESKSLNETIYQPEQMLKYLDIDVTESLLKSAIWGLVVDEGVSPSILGSKNMQSLIMPICEALSNKKNKKIKEIESETEKLICLAANQLRNDFSNILNGRLLSLKIDMDIDAPHNTFCITALFIVHNIIEKRILGVIDLQNDNTQLTEQHIKQVLHKYNIDSNQIINACCDFSKAKYSTDVKNSEYLKEIEKFEKHPNINFGSTKIERSIGVIAQLCLLDIFKNYEVLQPFLKCRNFVQFVSDKNNGFCEILEQNYLSIPQLDTPWKWGSTYNMMQDLQNARTFLCDIKCPNFENPDHQFEVGDNMWLFIDAFCQSAKFIQKSIIKYYTEEIHFGDFYAQWLKSKLLTGKLASETNHQNNYINKISAELLNSIEERSKLLLHSEERFNACLYLDPRFQHTLNLQEKSKAVNYLKELWTHSKIYTPDVVNTAREFQSQSFDDDDDDDEFLNEFLCQNETERIDKRTNAVYNKIEGLKLQFKSVDTNILLFWDNLKANEPELYELSAICFAIPITQNYNKSTYSHIYEAESISKISTFTRENLLSIRLNPHLVKNALENFSIFGERESEDGDDFKIVKVEMTNSCF